MPHCRSDSSVTAHHVMPSFFISHSHRDRELALRVRDWLEEERLGSGFLHFDPEGGLEPGKRWEEALYAELRRADVVLFLGTRASVASKWCFAELTLARSIGKTIVPVAIRGQGAHPLLGDTQAISITGTSKLDFVPLFRVLTAVTVHLERLFDWDGERSPFPGLQSFQERDAAVFFGRNGETDLLLEQVLSARRRHTGRSLALVGPSGSGKSSLVHAGLVPRLRRMDPAWIVLPVTPPGNRPLRQLALALLNDFQDAGDGRKLDDIQQRLDQGASGLLDLVDELRHLRRSDLLVPDVLVLVDQAEELFTDDADHSDFLAVLHAATRGSGSLWSLLTVRSDFLSASLQRYPGRFAFDEELLIGPLDPARIADVIERPADRAGINLERGLVARMVADTGGGDALPLLGHTLARLYQHMADEGASTISRAQYDALGGVVGALRRTADAESRRLSDRGLGAAVLPTLNRLVTVEGEGQATRRRVPLTAFDAGGQAVVRAFIDARLLTSTEVDGTAMVEVTHEALIRQWPPLAQEMEHRREELLLRSEVERAAGEWERSGRRREYLLPAERLNTSGRFAGIATGLDLTGPANAYFAASRHQRRVDAELKRTRRRLAMAGLAVTTLVVSALAVVALIQRHTANVQRDAAQSSLLANDALAALTTNPGQSVVYALRAYATQPTPFAEGVLRLATSQAAPQVVLRGNGVPLRGVAAAPDGRGVASGADDGTVTLWDWRTPRVPPVRLPGAATWAVEAVAFSPDGHELASGDQDGEVRLWDLRKPRSLPLVLPGGRGVSGVAFAGDGRHLAATDAFGTLKIWDLRAPRSAPVTLSAGINSGFDALAFAMDGVHLAAGVDDGTIRVWNWRSPRRSAVVLSVDGNNTQLTSLAFTDSGRYIAGALTDGEVRVWDLRRTRNPPLVLRGHQGPVHSVTFGPGGTFLASAGDDGTVRVWDWQKPGRSAMILRGHSGPVTGLALAGAGRFLASAGFDGTIRVWDWRATKVLAAVVHTGRGPVSATGLSGDGHRLATGSPLRIWDWRAPQRPVASLGDYDVRDLAFGPDGHHLASGGAGQSTVEVWDINTPRRPPVLLNNDIEGDYGLAFAPDGHHVASGTIEGEIRVWDWQAPTQPPIGLRGAFAGLAQPVLAFAGDSRHLAVADPSAANLAVWNWRAPRAKPVRLAAGGGPITAVAFAPDGQHLAIGDADGTVRIWDWRVPTGPPLVLQGHDGAINAVAFDGDGRDLATGGADGALRVWNWVSAQTPSTVLLTSQHPITAVAFASDERHLASASNDSVELLDCQRCGDLKTILALSRARAA